MKKISKILALVLIAAMALSLTACNSFEAKLTKAVKQMNEVKNLHMDMSFQISMAMTFMGQGMDMDLDMDMAADIQKEPRLMSMDMTLSMLGMSQQMQQYMEQTDEGYVMYLSEDGGKSWHKQDVPTTEAQSQISALDGMGLFLDCAKSFEEKGEESVLGSAAVRYDGVLEGAYIARAMEMSGAFGTLEETLGLELDEEDMENLGGIPTSLWIDKKSGMIVRYEMDMTEVMQSLTGNLVESLLGEYGLEGAGVSVELSAVVTRATLSNFDQVGEIVIPDAARAA